MGICKRILEGLNNFKKGPIKMANLKGIVGDLNNLNKSSKMGILRGILGDLKNPN